MDAAICKVRIEWCKEIHDVEELTRPVVSEPLSLEFDEIPSRIGHTQCIENAVSVGALFWDVLVTYSYVITVWEK